MKALRYLLIVIAMVSFLGANAQGLAQRPEIKMQSTSGMVYSGSALPSAAASGAVVTGSKLGTYDPADAVGKPNKAKKGEWNPGGEDPEEGENTEPWADPLGDAAWPLLMLAAAYALLRVYQRKKRSV